MLQYNKLYQSLKKVSAEWHAGHIQWQYYWNYLKFYDDGMVIYCSATDHNFKQINKWFDKDKKDSFLYRGKFHIENGFKIYINIQMSIGQLDLDGCVQNKSLILRIKNSVLNQIENWDEYTMID